MLRKIRAIPAVFLAFHLLFLVLTHGCATLPWDYPRPVSTALPLPEETRMGKRIQARVAEHHGKSGFYLLATGYDGFMARLLTMDRAERTLDLQYYVLHDDLTGKFLMDRLAAAADRGVRVRLLVDDWEQTGEKDWGLAMMQSHPHIEVRVFNPFGALRSFFLSRPLQAVFGPQRLKARMHNKVFIADNTVAIVGGRNIADEYFGARAGLNFGDMDIMAIGPITREVSAAFDDYWNCALSFPISALVKRQPTAADLEKARLFLAANRESVKNSEYAQRLREAGLAKQVEAGYVPFVWAEGEVLFDDPLKVIRPDGPSPKVPMEQKLMSIVAEAQSEVLMISPYFVPGKRGVQWFKELRERGVKVKILTNSLASTDVPLAEGGYARYRKALLRIGVELYELKPNPDQWRFWDRISLGGSSRGSLHAKTVIVDRQVVFVGSFNLDPRSARLNTEDGLVVRSPELAAQVTSLFTKGTSLSNAYRLEPRGSSRESEEWHGLAWVTEENGREVRYFKDPMTGVWCRFEVRLLSVLAPESML